MSRPCWSFHDLPISIVNLVEFTAVSKKATLHVIPAFADLINSKESQIRKRGPVRRKNRGVKWTVIVLRDDRLPFGRVEKLKIFLSNRPRSTSINIFVNQSDMRFSQNT